MNHVDHPEVTSVEWFFGAGGNHLGLKQVLPGLRLVAACEIEAYAVANLVAKMESGELDAAPIWSDVRTFPAHELRGRIALFVASYPCQPFSSAGLRLGASDPRHLWPYVIKAVRAMRPQRCFFENVEGHVSLGLSTVISDLEDAGYRVESGLFSAEEVGAPHRRKRVFILADSQHGTRRAKRRAQSRRWANEGAAQESMSRGDGAALADAPEQYGPIAGCLAPECGCGCATISDADDRRCGAGPELEILPDFAWCDLPRFPPGKTDYEAWARILAHRPDLEPALCRMDDGMANRVDRLRLCSNGVVPDTAALAWLVLDERLAVR